MTQRTPWEAFDDEHCRNERITSTISRIVSDIGIFVNLEGGIEGIVHLSDLDWVTPGHEAVSRYNIGDPIEVVILAIDPDRQRVSLGIKQHKPEPRQHPRGEPPIPAPVKPKCPRPPNPLSEAIEQ